MFIARDKSMPGFKKETESFVCLFVWDRVLLCSPGRPQTHDPPASASWVLGLQVFNTTLSPDWLLLGANAAEDFKLKPMLLYHSKNPIVLKGCTKSPLSINRAMKPGWQHICLQCGLLENLTFCYWDLLSDYFNFQVLLFKKYITVVHVHNSSFPRVWGKRVTWA
jgi:hypothetical protein